MPGRGYWATVASEVMPMACPAAIRVSHSSTVCVSRTAAGPEPGSELEIPLAYIDDHVIVVDKPAGVVTHPAPGVLGQTLVGALRSLGLRGGDDEGRPGVIQVLPLVLRELEAAGYRIGDVSLSAKR